MVKSNVMRCKSIIIGLVSSSILSLLALLVATIGPGTVYAQSQPPQPAARLSCNTEPLGTGFDLHVFIEDSDLASIADPGGMTRREITSLFVDATYLDGRIRGVSNYVRVWTYSETPTPQTDRTLLRDQSGIVGDSVYLDEQHQMIDEITFENGGIVANHIETLFEDGIRTTLDADPERPTLVVVLNEMTRNGRDEAEFASKALEIWDAATEERQSPSAIYIVDFAEDNEYGSTNLDVIRAWKANFFGDGPTINGEFRSINSSNALYEVGRIVQEFAALSTEELSVPFPTFNMLTSAESQLPVCLFSTVRYGVLLQNPIETDRSERLIPSAANPVEGRYALYGEVRSANGYFELTPNGRPLSQDLDALYIYRAVNGIQQVVCPPPAVFADETPSLSMEPPSLDNLTLRWGPVDNTESFSLSRTSHVDLEAGPVGLEPVEYEAILERQPEDAFNCGRTMIVPRPSMTILLNPEPVAGHPLTLTVAISPTGELSATPTVTLTRLSGFHTESAPSGPMMEMNQRNISPIQDEKTLFYEYHSDGDLSTGLWFVQGHIDARNDHHLPVRLSKEAAFYISSGGVLYPRVEITGTVRSVEPGEGITSTNGLLPFEWESEDGSVELSVTSDSILSVDANITTESIEPEKEVLGVPVIAIVGIIVGILFMGMFVFISTKF